MGYSRHQMFDTLNSGIEILKLPALTKNALLTAGVTKVVDLVQKTETDLGRRTKNVGAKGIAKIKAALEEHGLSLGMRIDADELRALEERRMVRCLVHFSLQWDLNEVTCVKTVGLPAVPPVGTTLTLKIGSGWYGAEVSKIGMDEGNPFVDVYAGCRLDAVQQAAGIHELRDQLANDRSWRKV